MKTIKSDHFKSMPWKNGGGITSELFALNEKGFSGFVFRLSVATVSHDGPFSLYPDIERTLFIIEGEGCELYKSNGIVKLQKDSPPFIFQGEEQIDCKRINGTFKDFNVMINRHWGRAKADRLSPHTTVKATHDFTLVFLIEENVLVILERDETFVPHLESILVSVETTSP